MTLPRGSWLVRISRTYSYAKNHTPADQRSGHTVLPFQAHRTARNALAYGRAASALREGVASRAVPAHWRPRPPSAWHAAACPPSPQEPTNLPAHSRCILDRQARARSQGPRRERSERWGTRPEYRPGSPGRLASPQSTAPPRARAERRALPPTARGLVRTRAHASLVLRGHSAPRSS